MTFASRLLSLVYLGLASVSYGQSAYLETIPLTFQWNLAATGVTGATINNTPPVSPPDGTSTTADGGFLDPDKITPLPRITTETGKPVVYVPKYPTVYGGNQNFFSRQIYQTIAYLTLTGQIDSRIGEIEAGTIDYDSRWEITAIREAQTSVAGVGSTPYSFWLTRINPLTGRPAQMLRIPAYGLYDIVPTPSFASEPKGHLGLSITMGPAIGSYTEEFTGENLTRATGTLTIPVTVRFGSILFDDFPADTLARRNLWDLVATGYMTVALKTNKGAAPVLAGTSAKIAGSGAFLHNYHDLSDRKFIPVTFTGIGPVKIIGGVPKYQNRAFLESVGYNANP